MSDKHVLIYSKPTSSPHPVDLPPHITRHYIPTSLGTLELLAAQPPPALQSGPRKKAILFQHGGFGCAATFIPFLTYFSQQNHHPAYALSLRGHGVSWTPSFWRMVWGYPKSAFASDLQAGIQFVQSLEAESRGSLDESDIVLVGHSAGGGISQFLLSEGMGKVGGYVIMAGFPCFGGWGCYWNWFKLDPWFVPRYYLRDLWHPRSPLSSTALVHNAFFCPEYPVEQVREFETLMPEYESMLWPLQMMFRFVKTENVVKNVLGWGEGKEKRIMVVAGSKDTLMGVDLMRTMAEEYRAAVRKLWNSLIGDQDTDGSKGATGQTVNGVEFEVIMGSGHHLQNDLYWKECATKILIFVGNL